MDIEINPNCIQSAPPNDSIVTLNKNIILDYLVNNDTIVFKSQQRGEPELSRQEKMEIAENIFDKSKLNFLSRFGKYLPPNYLNMFEDFQNEDEEYSQISLLLKQLHTQNSKKNEVNRKNRRFEALRRLIEEDKYFSEVEMMKRNPLLYEQLVGQYLSENEKRERDKVDTEQITFVKILMEGMERDQADNKMKIQQENEDNAMEEEDSDEDIDSNQAAFIEPKPSTSKWGEFPGTEDENPIRRYGAYTPQKKFITAQERQLLKSEFTTLMYQNFLDGNDEEFDYKTVDDNEAYDNIDIVNNDEEDKYFDEEQPEELNMNVDVGNRASESSEDELDIYMNALNQHPSVCQLAKDLRNL